MNKIYQKPFFVRKNAGFTLIELLVVVLIIGILAAVAIPQYTKAVEKSRASQALTTLKSLGQAYQAYYIANGQYPSSFDQLDLSMEWTGNEKWFNNAADTRFNGDWSLQIITGGGYNGLYLGRIKGKYRGGGFGWFFVSPVGHNKENILCMERISTGMVFQQPAHSYCEKLFHAALMQTAGGTRSYRMR